MKRMTYRKLMQKIDDGDVDFNAWGIGDYDGENVADVTIRAHNPNNPDKRQLVLVTNVPAELNR